MENATELLQGLAKVINTDKIVSKADIQTILTGIFKLLAQFKKETQDLNKETKQEVDDVMKLLKILQKELYQDIKDGKKEMEVQFKEQYDELVYLINEFKKIKPEDGAPGEKGADADEDAIVERVMEMIRNEDAMDSESEDSKEMDGGDIIDKINGLDYSSENLIDVRRIKGWENFGKSSKKGFQTFSPTVLSNAMDLDQSARADGYAIVWDDTNKRHKYAASAGGGSMAIGSSVTSGTSGSILYIDSAGKLAQENASFFWDDTNNRLLVGANSTPVTIANSTAVVNTGLAFVTAFGYGAVGSSGGFFAGYGSAGTPGTPTAIQSGGTLAALSGRGYDGTGWTSGSQASIVLATAENWSSSARGTSISFNTTPTGSTTNTGVGIFSSAGNFNVGSAVAQNSRLSIIGTRTAAYVSNGGVNFTAYDHTFTDSSSTGTVSTMRSFVLGTPTIVASSATTYTNASNFYISGAPVASTNVTFTNAWALYVASGASGFGGSVLPIAGATYDLGNSTLTWGNLFMGSAKKIDFASDVTITHATDLLSFAGAATGYYFDTKVGIGTNAPTHSLTLNSTATGIVLYNTVDQVTNYERVKMYWNANVYTIQLQKGGTGTNRDMTIGTVSRTFQFKESPTGNNGFYNFVNSTGVSAYALSIQTTRSASTGVSAELIIAPTYNQTSTAGATDLLINRTQTAVGSGAQLFIDMQVDGVSKLNITNGGVMSITSDFTSTTASINIGGGTNVSNYAMAFSGGRSMIGFESSGGNTYIASGSSKGLAFYPNLTSGTPPTSLTGVSIFIQGNSANSPVGNVAINNGTTNPTAKLHIGAGSATANTAPLKFTSGVNLTTPETGAVEYDGTWMYATLTGTTRRTFVFADTAQIITNKRNQPRVYSTASTATLTPEIDTYDIFHVTALAAGITIANHSTSTPADGEQIRIRLLDNGTARSITFGTNYVAKSGVALPTTTTLSKNMVMLFEWNANLSKFNLLAVGTEA